MEINDKKDGLSYPIEGSYINMLFTFLYVFCLTLILLFLENMYTYFDILKFQSYPIEGILMLTNLVFNVGYFFLAGIIAIIATIIIYKPLKIGVWVVIGASIVWITGLYFFIYGPFGTNSGWESFGFAIGLMLYIFLLIVSVPLSFLARGYGKIRHLVIKIFILLSPFILFAIIVLPISLRVTPLTMENCEKIDSSYSYSDCFHELALKEKNPFYCFKMTEYYQECVRELYDYLDVNTCNKIILKDYEESFITNKKEKCFITVAIKFKDESICNSLEKPEEIKICKDYVFWGNDYDITMVPVANYSKNRENVEEF